MATNDRFLPWLPGSESAAPIVADDLELLLSSEPDELWGLVRSDASLSVLLDTFLRYARRPYDEDFASLSTTQLAVWRLMLTLLHRLVCGRERGMPAARERAQLLAPLLTVPAVLDAAALYGASGGQQLQELLDAAFSLQPRLSTELTRAAATIADNVGQVAEACQGAVGGAAAGDAGMLRSLRDGVLYLRDTCLTLCALVRARPPAAGALLADGPGLIEALGAVHDQLMPAAVAALGPRPAAVPLLALCREVELGAERLVQLLLLHGYLDEAAAAGAGAGSSGAAASSSSGSSSSGAAVARGEALLHAVMAMGHREEEASGAAGGGLGLGPALAERYGLGGSIETALHTGRISLDEAQRDYLAALLDVASLVAAPAPVPGMAGIDAASSAAGDSGPAAGAGDAVLLLSRIQQVRELLPDYGEGFVAACLDALGGSAERVLDALLEGSPPAAAAGLDRGLGLAAYQAQQQRQGDTAGAVAVDKGKRPMEAELLPPVGPGARSGDSFTAAAPWLPSSRAVTTPQQLQQRIETNTAKFLDIREEGYQQSLLSTATAMQYEYEDEYDDSFDDLITFGNDGVAEAEEAEGHPSRAGPGSVSQEAALTHGVGDLSLGAGSAGLPGPPASERSRGRGRGPPSKGRLWVLDGRVYNYPKPGAKEVASQADAQATIAAAQQASEEIMGLGPGGNVPPPPPAQQQQQQQQASEVDGGRGPGGSMPGGGRGGGTGGRGGGRGGRGDGSSGGGRGSHRYKDQHKGAIANHHRRERALAKQAKGAW